MLVLLLLCWLIGIIKEDLKQIRLEKYVKSDYKEMFCLASLPTYINKDCTGHCDERVTVRFLINSIK